MGTETVASGPLAAPLRRPRRAFRVGVGLMVASGALMFAAWAAFWPLFQAE